MGTRAAAIREDEDAARALGKPVFRYKLQSLAIAAVLASIAGYLLALDLAFLEPGRVHPRQHVHRRRDAARRRARSYRGVLIGSLLIEILLNATPSLNLIGLPLSDSQVGALRFIVIGRCSSASRCGGRRACSGAATRSAAADGGPSGSSGAGAAAHRRRSPPHVSRCRRGGDASFDVAAGSITALIGPNGAGKTTVFDLVSGFLSPDGGHVLFDGRPIAGAPPERIARAGLVRTFQLTRTFATLSVMDNMLVGAAAHPGERLLSVVLAARRSRRREREARDQASELLERFGLSAHAAGLAGTLSGGQRKLLELARALMAEPRLLLLDEPMAGVNPTLGRRLLEHIERVRASDGVTVLFVEHDLEVVMRHAEHVIVMDGGTSSPTARRPCSRATGE